MIGIKHLLDSIDPADGRRIWVEPIGLTRDFIEWCQVHHLLTHVAPPEALWRWYQSHPDGYEFFRGRYHAWLAQGPYVPALQELACSARAQNITLLHQEDDPARNTASALQEFLSELEAYCPREP
jgi:uncharacterized protein YeaO (DUF488 family)